MAHFLDDSNEDDNLAGSEDLGLTEIDTDEVPIFDIDDLLKDHPTPGALGTRLEILDEDEIEVKAKPKTATKRTNLTLVAGVVGLFLVAGIAVGGFLLAAQDSSHDARSDIAPPQTPHTDDEQPDDNAVMIDSSADVEEVPQPPARSLSRQETNRSTSAALRQANHKPTPNAVPAPANVVKPAPKKTTTTTAPKKTTTTTAPKKTTTTTIKPAVKPASEVERFKGDSVEDLLEFLKPGYSYCVEFAGNVYC